MIPPDPSPSRGLHGGNDFLRRCLEGEVHQPRRRRSKRDPTGAPPSCPAVAVAGAMARGRNNGAAAFSADIETGPDATNAVPQRRSAQGKPEVEPISTGLDGPG